jgi:hypothetical protein
VITAGVDLPDAALAAEVAAGLEQVEDGLREAARAEHEPRWPSSSLTWPPCTTTT